MQIKQFNPDMNKLKYGKLLFLRVLVFSFYLIVSSQIFAQDPRQIMQQGNEAYSKGDYQAAVDAYNSILDAGLQSADLYYNLGNAYYRMDEIGLSVLNYERALRLKPNFRDAQQNLDFVNSKTEDEIASLPQLFLVQWARTVVNWFAPTGWLVVLLILVALLGTVVVLFFVGSDYAWRKRSLVCGLILCVLLILATACAISSHVRYNRHDHAVVTSPMIVVKSSPEEHSVDKMILHEGTKVAIEETLGTWHKIQIADGNTGWIQSDEVTII